MSSADSREDEEDDLEDLEGGMSYEEFSQNLYRERYTKFHTEILRPDPFTSMDDYADYCMTHISPKVGLMIFNHQHNYRVNMIPYKRKRAEETERIAKGNTDDRKRREDIKSVLRGTND